MMVGKFSLVIGLSLSIMGLEDMIPSRFFKFRLNMGTRGNLMDDTFSLIYVDD